MNAPKLAQMIGTLRFSEALPVHVVEQIAALATVREFAAGTVVFREGARNDQLMIVARGRMALDMSVPGRGDVRVMSVGPGDMVAWSAVLGGGGMTTSAVALEDTEVACVPAADVLALCQSDPLAGFHLMRELAKALANRLVATRLQLLDLFADQATAVSENFD